MPSVSLFVIAPVIQIEAQAGSLHWLHLVTLWNSISGIWIAVIPEQASSPVLSATQASWQAEQSGGHFPY
jgi:hypothetical protein